MSLEAGGRRSGFPIPGFQRKLMAISQVRDDFGEFCINECVIVCVSNNVCHIVALDNSYMYVFQL